MRIPPLVASFLASLASTNTDQAADCRGVNQWQSNFAYKAGDNVIYENDKYTATQWNWNEVPPAHSDIWTYDGYCRSMFEMASCWGVPQWSKTVAYQKGSKVVYNGHLWVAVQWVESNSPGDASGSWQDLGACS